MSCNENAVEVRDLSIKYRGLQSYSIKKNFLHFKPNKVEFFEALKHISFDVKKGKILGLVGKNGSGKSTLLNAIAGIFAPDTGSIDLKGNSVSLLSIGVGFQKELSGRENIKLCGLLLGFSEKEVSERTPDIIGFSSLGDFIDKPVRTYSSGMYSKLAFSITAILETDIILIDEVFSVGDVTFKKKSEKKIRQLIYDEDRTVIIVSHNMQSVKELCTEVMWLHDGEIKMQGPTEGVLDAYVEFMEK
jgi:ABC-type polysaccharide/polyol phosphate transport system ATPase subunit